MRKGRLITLSLMVISLSLVASIGMSVAWYADGAYLRVSNIDVSLMSEPQLGLSLTESDNLDDYHFGEFPYDELPKMKGGYSDDYVEGQEYTGNNYVPVSSMYSKDWIGQYDEDGNLLDPQFCRNYKRASRHDESTFKKTKLAVSGYYSVPLYMYCDRSMYATIDASGTTFTPNHEANVSKAKELQEEDPSIDIEQMAVELDNVVNSLRFSIYDCETEEYWIIDPNKGETTTYLGGVLDLDANKVFDLYYDTDASEYREFLYGEYDNVSDIIYKDADNPVEIENYDTFNAKHAPDAKEVDIESCIENGVISKENSYTPEQLSKMDLITLKTGVPHRIVLSIYIEGWDRDNTNVSSYGAFYSSIKFKLTTPYYAS